MNADNGQEKIAVLISANAEWKAIRSLLPDFQLLSSPFGQWFEVQLPSPLPGAPSFPLLFFQGGWGKISAAASTQFVIDRWNPPLLINLGTCGGFSGEIERGEIVLADRTIVYDIFEQMGDFQEHIDFYTSHLDVSWVSGPFPFPVRKTLLISGDRDLVPADLDQLKRQYQACAGDWESGAIAFVAVKNKVPLLILRGVTDLVDDSCGEAYDNPGFFAEAAFPIMEKLLRQLPEWIALFEANRK